MTPEDQRIAMAKALGWKVVQGDNGLLITHEGDVFCEHFPDYLNDLNAMHEAEGVILNPNSPIVWVNYEERGEIKRAYQDNLERAATLGGASAICATAAQRAEAFLRTLDLWTNQT